MQIHTVLGLNGPDSLSTLAATIQRVYPNRHRKLGDRPAWLVSDNSTAKAVSEKLGINSGDGGISALVTTMSDYFGRAETDLWSRIKVQWETPADGSTDPKSAAA